MSSPVAAHTQNLYLGLPPNASADYERDYDHNFRMVDFITQNKSNVVVSGLAVTAGAGLTVNWAAGSATVNGTTYTIGASSGSATDNTADTNIHLPNYIFVNNSGAVTINTSLPTTEYTPLAIVFTNAGSISKVVDGRIIISSSDTIVNKTSAYTLVAADLTGRKTFTNSGGGASVVPFTFPAAVAGNKVSFEVADSGGLSIDPNGVEIFKVNNVSMGAGQAITYKTQGLRIDVICVVAGELIVKASGVKRGCLVYPSANQTITVGAIRKVAWDSKESGADPEGMHDTVTNNSRVTIPSGVTKVRITANIASDGAGNIFSATVLKDDASFVGSPMMSISTSGVYRVYNIVSPVINVSAGQYLEIACESQTSNAIVYASQTPLYLTAKSWFAVEIIE